MTANHEHTPTTQEVQWAAITTTFEDSSITEDAFNRWLDARDARIVAAAEQRGAARGKIEGLREAAAIIRDSKFANSDKPPSKKVRVKEADWLDALADRLEGVGA